MASCAAGGGGELIKTPAPWEGALVTVCLSVVLAPQGKLPLDVPFPPTRPTLLCYPQSHPLTWLWYIQDQDLELQHNNSQCK